MDSESCRPAAGFMVKKKFKQFLELNGFDFHQLNRSGWQSFEIEHGDPKIKKDNYRLIDSKVDKKNGLYIYMRGNVTMYIGKGKPLANRIKSHYNESYKKTNHTKNKPWHEYFSSDKNNGRLKLLWKEVEPEDERVILEKMLEYINPSEFMDFKNKLKK